MKITFLNIAALSTIVLFSCNKENNHVDDFTNEVCLETAQITLPTSGGELIESESLVQSSNNDYYTAGQIDYIQNGEIVAQVNFGNGEENSIAQLTKDGNTSTFDLKKDNTFYKGKKSKYKKVIVKPLIKSEDCDYIISGVIKYFSIKTGKWVATIDFGERTCDEWATKTTDDDDGKEFTFSLDDWKYGKDWK
jgi:hypothetical protein